MTPGPPAPSPPSGGRKEFLVFTVLSHKDQPVPELCDVGGGAGNVHRCAPRCKMCARRVVQRALLTVEFCISSMARAASSGWENSTIPQPLERPPAPSVRTSAYSTVGVQCAVGRRNG